MLNNLRNWFRGIFSAGSETPTKLPSQINDNQFLAASANAALMDRQTGAYDKYLFESHEIPEMPFEAAVDGHLNLMASRLSQRFSREISKAERQRIAAIRQLEVQSLRKAHYQSGLEMAQAQLESHEEVLRGAKMGRQGLSWTGESPSIFRVSSARLRLAARYLIFLAVGGIDLFIVFLSINNLNIGFIEAVFLTAPAVAAQLAFPHLAGVRLAFITRGMVRRISIWLETLALLGLWFAFIWVMTGIRVQFIISQIRRTGASTSELAALEPIFIGLNLVLLLTLGGWLLILAIRENPHELDALRAKLRIMAFEKKLVRCSMKVLRAQQRLDDANEVSETLKKETETAIFSSKVELSTAAKAIYRRALINEMADPEFTRSYYGDVGADDEKSK